MNKNLSTDDEQKELYKRGFLIDVDINELEKISNGRLKANTDTSNKLFRIWTTSKCNAQCFYCFEQGVKTETLTLDICDKVIDYISSFIHEGDKITIEWFGGEPLLNIAAIDKITKALKEKCDVKNAKYASYFISNGSLITPEIISKMESEWSTKYIQITLDGSRSAYNKIKNYFNPIKYNFDKVIDNILLFKNSKIRVSLRLNYTKDNYEDLIELLDYIGPKVKNSKNIMSYVYPIWSCTLSTDKNKFVSTVNADKNLLSIFDKILEYNLNEAKRLIRITRKVTSCKSCNIDSCTILPNGDIAKCSETFINTYGTVEEGITKKDEYKNWSMHPLSTECRECVFLPICQGGCKASNYIDMPKCFIYKPIIDDILIWYVNKLNINS